MKILITGANGMLAQEVKKQLKEGNELICTDVADLDITNENQVIEYIEKLKSKYQIPVFDYTNLKEGKMLLNVFDFEVIFTPGHTDDSVTYYFKEDDVMFTGDFIFKESIGRTDLETGDDLKMKMSLKKIKTYPDTTKIYPGHGMSSTLEYEKQKNIYLSEGFYD